MNRFVCFGVAIFFAVVGIALLGGEEKANAGLFRGNGCGGCAGDCGGVADCGGRDRCCGLFGHKCRCSGDCGGKADCCGAVVDDCCGRKARCHGRDRCCGLFGHKCRCSGNDCGGYVEECGGKGGVIIDDAAPAPAPVPPAPAA